MALREAVIQGEKVWFTTATGRVQGLQIWTKTTVTGSGGGGHSGPYGGFNEPVSVSSTTKVFREFWVVTPEGNEHRIIYDEGLFSVRDGQKVSILWGASARQSSGPYLAILNRSVTGANIYRLSGNYEALLKAMGLKARRSILLLVGLLVPIYLILRPFGIAIFLIFGLLIWVAAISLISSRSEQNLWNAVFEEIRQCF